METKNHVGTISDQEYLLNCIGIRVVIVLESGTGNETVLKKDFNLIPF